LQRVDESRKRKSRKAKYWWWQDMNQTAVKNLALKMSTDILTFLLIRSWNSSYVDVVCSQSFQRPITGKISLSPPIQALVVFVLPGFVCQKVLWTLPVLHPQNHPS
jgi:hypothetical protein